MLTKGVAGVWTPGGEVICLTCHGEALKYNRPGKVRGWDFRHVERKPEDGEGVTLCEGCRAAIIVRADVAAIRQFAWLADDTDVAGTGGAQMQQTGGMCCGCRIDFVDGKGEPTGRFAFVSESMGSADARALLIGLYTSDDAFESGEPTDYEEFTDLEAGVAKLREWAK